MSSVNLFNIGKSGLFTSRAKLGTTGHNISNVNTKGYSRQRVESSAAHPQNLGGRVFGSGSRVGEIRRVNDEFLTEQIAKEMKLKGEYEEKDVAFAQADNVFNEVTNEGLNRLIAKFFNEFRKLGNEPESEALRTTVRESARQMIGDFRRVHRSLRDIQDNIDIRIDASVRKANELIQNISHLNQKIKEFELGGGESGDLRDKREVAVNELSEILDIRLALNEDGEYTVSVSNVGPLLTGAKYNELYTRKTKMVAETGRPEAGLGIFLKNRANPEVTEFLHTGRLGGLVDARDRVLGTAINRVDELAYNFATRINEVHKKGHALNGTFGVNFFKDPGEMHRASELLSLSDEIMADENNIATALLPNAPGDNRVVQMIGKIQHDRVMSGGVSTMDEFYNATVADVATAMQKNKEVLEHQGHVLGQLEKMRESISGVSLDEETANLIQYQHAFDASAKVVKVADELLQEVLNIRA